MNLRPSTSSDWQAVGEIHDRCKPDEMRGAVAPSATVPFASDSPTQDIYRRSSFTVAEENGEVIGFVGMIGRYVSALCVDPDHRRHGAATALMRTVLDSADGPVCLNVGKRNVTAIRLYERLGFTTDVEFVGKFNGIDVEVLHMRHASAARGPIDPMGSIKSSQQQWATAQGIAFDADGYTMTADENLFGGLSEPARADYLQGDGAELGVDGTRGKLQALHSSSALACNMFDFWRGKDLAPLSRALGMASPLVDLTGLEHKLSTGLRGKGPNLDVFLRCADGTSVGIESKFTEPYAPSSLKTWVKPAYFRNTTGVERALWTAAGLPNCQQIAEALRAGTHEFKTLDVAQLLKHMLALTRTGDAWILCYVWYDCRGVLADQHRQEVAEFRRRLGDEGRYFQSLTYRELFFRMLPHVSDDAKDYIAYIRERYINPTA